MIARTLKRLRRRPIHNGVLIACGALVAAAVVLNGVDCVRYVAFRAALARASSIAPVARTTEAGWTFRFVKSRCKVSVEVDAAELATAQEMDTGAVFGSGGWLRDRCVAELVRTQSRSALIDRLAAEFRRIRDERNLTDDEYLELLASAVQQIPYGKVQGGLQLPAEILVSGTGVCTDKTVLLGSLLVHEGYDTVLWVFDAPNHVALGVASDGARFRGTDYAFVETTAPRFVGQAGAEYRAPGPIARPPRTIALGGWRSYASGDEVDVILRELERARATQHAWRRYATAMRFGPSQPRLAHREIESWVADATAAFILSHTHDRQSVYALLRGRSAEGPAPARALVQ